MSCLHGLTAIERKQTARDSKEQQNQEYQEAIKSLHARHDVLVLRKAEIVLKYKDAIRRMQPARQEFLGSSITLIEATSEVATLTARNKDVQDRLIAERTIVKETERRAAEAKADANKAIRVCTQLLADEDLDPAYQIRINEHIEHKQVEELQNEIHAESAKLEFMHVGNTNALNEFATRQVEIDKLHEKISVLDTRLRDIQVSIDALRGQWEPALDQLISHISDAFAHNFEQIGCAGEVSIYKDDDFRSWAIQIKVKFRCVASQVTSLSSPCMQGE